MQPPQPSRRQLLGALLAGLFGGPWAGPTRGATSPAPPGPGPGCFAGGSVTVTTYTFYDAEDNRIAVVYRLSSPAQAPVRVDKTPGGVTTYAYYG